MLGSQLSTPYVTAILPVTPAANTQVIDVGISIRVGATMWYGKATLRYDSGCWDSWGNCSDDWCTSGLVAAARANVMDRLPEMILYAAQAAIAKSGR